jgi:hypothetical protein
MSALLPLLTHWNEARIAWEEYLKEQGALLSWERSHLLLRYGSGTYAVTVLLPDSYKGSDQVQPAQQQRNINGTFVQVMSPVIKRDWLGTILLDKQATGSITYDNIVYQRPTRTETLTAIRAADLEVKSFEDPDFWEALWDYRWSPEMSFQRNARMTRMGMRLMEV